MNQELYNELTKPIPIEQVEFRVQSISEKGWATLLAYKDARVDINRLNEVLGQGNWQRKHEIIDGNLYCSVGINIQGDDEVPCWSWVQDVGTESYTEKEKGAASDSFKRACFNLGIGIELYDYPLLLVQLKKHEFYTYFDKKADKTKAKQTFDLHLKDWTWEADFKGSKILSLRAFDEKKGSRFQFPRNWTKPKQQAAPAAKPAAKPNQPPAANQPLKYDVLFGAITAASTLDEVKSIRPQIMASKDAKLLNASQLSQLTEHYKDKQIQLKAGDNG